ncbi:MAG TPA: ATP-binding protein [Solimonas sp.]|nr:ATP-binding protein [Solimonas sp.]
MTSLRTRLLVAASLVLTGFVILAGVVLERAFTTSLLQAEQEKLSGLVYALLGAATPNLGGELMITLDSVPDPRLRQPLSGLEAALLDSNGTAIWRSAPFFALPQVMAPAVGDWQFKRLDLPDAFSLAFGLRWIDIADAPRRYTVVVLEDASAFDRQLAVFRRTLWGWLGGTALALTAVLLLVLRWGLKPLNQLGFQLHRVEGGDQQQLEGHFPAELEPLAEAINALIRTGYAQLERQRNALGDLAHSLKTPLAVLRGMTEQNDLDAEPRGQLREQVNRMNHIVDHQLQRAATAGPRVLSKPIPVRPLAEKLTSALGKVYNDKQLQFDVQVPSPLRARVEQNDLYELLGNLLDNAAKYGRRLVRISGTTSGLQCVLTVEDDGSGFPEHPEKLLERGVRADSQALGQGIGLSLVKEMVDAYQGQLRLERSTVLGGAKIVATLPSR